MKQIHPRLADWKNHFAYSYVRYIVLVIAACLAWSLLFSVSEPETPMDRRVDLLFVGIHDHEEAKAWVTGIQNVVPEGHVVEYLTVPSPDAVLEESSSIILFSHLESRDGDLMILPYEWFSYLAGEGAVLPLTGTGEGGTSLLSQLEIPDFVELDYGYAYYKDPETDEISTELCGIPLGKLAGFRDLGLDPSDSIACVPFYCENRDSAMTALNWILTHKQEQTDNYWFPTDTVFGEEREAQEAEKNGQ